MQLRGLERKNLSKRSAIKGREREDSRIAVDWEQEKKLIKLRKGSEGAACRKGGSREEGKKLYCRLPVSPRTGKKGYFKKRTPKKARRKAGNER